MYNVLHLVLGIEFFFHQRHLDSSHCHLSAQTCHLRSAIEGTNTRMEEHFFLPVVKVMSFTLSGHKEMP